MFRLSSGAESSDYQEVFHLGWSGNVWLRTGPRGLGGAVTVRPLPWTPWALLLHHSPELSPALPATHKSEEGFGAFKRNFLEIMSSILVSSKARMGHLQRKQTQMRNKWSSTTKWVGMKLNNPLPAGLSSFQNSRKPVGPGLPSRREGSWGCWGLGEAELPGTVDKSQMAGWNQAPLAGPQPCRPLGRTSGNWPLHWLGKQLWGEWDPWRPVRGLALMVSGETLRLPSQEGSKGRSPLRVRKAP